MYSLSLYYYCTFFHPSIICRNKILCLQDLMIEICWKEIMRNKIDYVVYIHTKQIYFLGESTLWWIRVKEVSRQIIKRVEMFIPQFWRTLLQKKPNKSFQPKHNQSPHFHDVDKSKLIKIASTEIRYFSRSSI